MIWSRHSPHARCRAAAKQGIVFMRYALIAVVFAASPAALAAELPADAVLAPALTQMQPAARTMPAIVARFRADNDSVEHVFEIAAGPGRQAALAGLYRSWQQRLAQIDGNALGLEDSIDHLLFARTLEQRLRMLAFAAKRFAQAEPLLPGVRDLLLLLEARRQGEVQHGRETADRLDAVRRALAKRTAALDSDGLTPARSRAVLVRAASIADGVRGSLKDWFDYYADFDPELNWWLRSPWQALDEQLQTSSKALRLAAGASDEETIVGDPIGRDALVQGLADEMIPYSPEQLMQLAERELAWGEGELSKAAAELGYADWHQALEQVKGMYVAPGQQTALARSLAQEAVAFLDQHDLVTVPALARIDWRMNMLSPQAQLQAPFFLGGEDVWVASPTAEMAHQRKLMTLRGNNRYFSRAVVHHELIPGHHLQHFYGQRYNPERQLFQTPFWSEGWSLYWELRLWDMGFAHTPEERIGMLFWRNHRAARILFSLGFHLGKVSPEQAIEMLVQRVGHERDNAAAEVRRSFAGDYPPLYQAGYLLGGLQLQALQREIVGSGKMTDRAFHDAILRGGPMPIEMVRARLLAQPPAADFAPSWRFYPLPANVP
ncbi:MAG: DUF885 domain-containing protein [Lysobacterales bacterium CG17_big_fil_post_rev_8_21_14_2_50_64_11]|nr:MAG: DUF885 domain-containing protein [Xanthomonadales bacterium CG17_big_fil_post_rev_8_21_14_2_50_64_11]PIX60560.1 MAG: DUF885 domain-containing protein [Xanthomonadales bacterium CG_4_10_14_3_um_filter_64_11]